MIRRTFAIYEARCDRCEALLGVESTTSSREPIESLEDQAYRTGWMLYTEDADSYNIDAEKAKLYCSLSCFQHRAEQKQAGGG